ncbi:MAG: GDSL-type esterase/lipase family protein [Cyanobacteriota bacterium]|nr:GDSL-type esterase/lipase family protein [Cyanobacteriota bacterium]
MHPFSLLATGLVATFSIAFSTTAVSAEAIASSKPSVASKTFSIDRSSSPPQHAQFNWELHSDLTSRRPVPVSGAQLYYQRVAAANAGFIHTRLPRYSFRAVWVDAIETPTHEQWQELLATEATVMADAQEDRPLSIVLGDSLSLWMPASEFSDDRLWLNQGISGDTTGGILSRLRVLDATNPDRIYLMAGINDIKIGLSDEEILANYHQILEYLRQTHPYAETIVQSILPTRRENLPNDRIRELNRQLAEIAAREGATFVDLQVYFTDASGDLQPNLTTDGLHLSPQGYQVWQWVIEQIELGIAMGV